MDNNKTQSLLRYAARKAAKNQFFLAEHLTEFRGIRGMTDDDLARFLGCTPEMLPKLALCRRPDTESPSFRSDVEQIATAFAIQPVRLVQLIREVDTLKTLSEVSLTNQKVPDGLLAVARDDEGIQSGHKEMTDPSDNKEEKT